MGVGCAHACHCAICPIAAQTGHTSAFGIFVARVCLVYFPELGLPLSLMRFYRPSACVLTFCPVMVRRSGAFFMRFSAGCLFRRAAKSAQNASKPLCSADLCPTERFCVYAPVTEIRFPRSAVSGFLSAGPSGVMYASGVPVLPPIAPDFSPFGRFLAD